ncbi:phosphomannomutase/phosphoglucomutase [Mucisphaera calidilacus]|uniref:Phosphomannomutase/phosphoglucomutase n=1 Tax=Mucisphaera calidilacus TaxID=2527982 RepID=A0A518BZU6_9BACT|nr:phosphomannomutase/phosphoglucomutase [Mucisphaera calidilacus]QDU72491.1 Phosphomannomutase/phosphoglucomutase [Mucisphaera calidilacus]
MLPKIFKAYDVRATHPDPLNEDAAYCVGFGAGQFLQKENDGPGKILVSRDMRPHSPKLAAALIHGIRASGMDVIDLGMADTSFLYFAIPHLDAVGGIQTTASHNPVQYNGFKISGKGARPIGATTGLKEIEQLASDAWGSKREATGSLEELDLWDDYRKHIHTFLPTLNRPLKLYVDASNGMAGKLVPQVFDGVENLEVIKLNFEITGSFVHDPNPLVAENMVPTQEGVRQNAAHLGACFDGDADRCMLVDEQGSIIGCDHLTAWLASHFLKQDPGSTIIYDLRSSKVVEETIKSLGGTPAKSRVGHVFMKALLRETGGVFGGELSGHFYFRDNSFADSGAILLAVALGVLAETDQPLSSIINPLKKYPQSGEINFRTEDKESVLAALKSDYAEGAVIDELDGVSIDAFENKGWWFNVRASNTEPLLRLNAEARDPEALASLLGELKPRLGEEAQGH